MKFGDIITYLDDDYCVTHRIISKNYNSIITKGDNNNEIDNKISSNKVLGKVVFSSILLGNFIRKYLKSIFIMFTIFVIGENILFNFKEKDNSEKIKIKKSE